MQLKCELACKKDSSHSSGYPAKPSEIVVACLPSAAIASSFGCGMKAMRICTGWIGLLSVGVSGTASWLMDMGVFFSAYCEFFFRSDLSQAVNELILIIPPELCSDIISSIDNAYKLRKLGKTLGFLV
jgi:hypothetical protein